MYKTELELEKRLNDLAMANVPSGSYENIVILPKYKKTAPLEMSPDEYDLRDLAYDQKLNVIASNAIVDKLGWKPSKIKSDVTKAMIQDYQFEQMKNINNQLYTPSSLDLDLLEEPDDPGLISDRERNALFAELRRGSDAMTEIQRLLSEAPERLRERKDLWESALQANLLRADRLYPSLLQRSRAKVAFRRQADADLIEINREYDAYLARLRAEYILAETATAEFTQRFRDNESIKKEYEREVQAVQQENDKRRRIFEDTVRSMNIGRNDVSRLPEETDDEYKQRLEDIGDSTFNEDLIAQSAALFFTDRLREQMREVTRDEVLIGDFIRRLNSDERYSLVKPLTKMWENFKKKILEIFGQNNQYMSADDLYNVAVQLADQVAIQEAREPDLYKERPVGELIEALTIEEGTPVRDVASADVVVSSGGKYQFSTEARQLSDARFRALKDYSEGKPLKTTFQGQPANDITKRIFDQEAQRISQFLNPSVAVRAPAPGARAPAPARPGRIPSVAELHQEIETSKQLSADQDIVDQLDRLLSITNRTELLAAAERLGFQFDFQKEEALTGFGLSKKYPKIVPFGLVQISPHKLFYENILKITRNGKNLTGYPNLKVSDAFVTFLFKILNGQNPTLKEANTLSPNEKNVFDSLIFTAGLQKMVETTGTGLKQELKNRLALIEGEIEAGNTNTELIKEARKILQNFARMKVIGHRAASEHLKQLMHAQRR
jgi:hypothetical protein